MANPAWKKGIESPNPNGRPTGSFSITELVRKKLQELPEGEDKKTYAVLFIEKLFEKATKEGDEKTLKLIWNYIDGLPSQSVDLTSNGKDIVIPIYGRQSVQGHDSDPESVPAEKKD